MEQLFVSQVRFIDMNSTLKPLGSEVTIEQDNTSGIQLKKEWLEIKQQKNQTHYRTIILYN